MTASLNATGVTRECITLRTPNRFDKFIFIFTFSKFGVDAYPVRNVKFIDRVLRVSSIAHRCGEQRKYEQKQQQQQFPWTDTTFADCIKYTVGALTFEGVCVYERV